MKGWYFCINVFISNLKIHANVWLQMLFSIIPQKMHKAEIHAKTLVITREPDPLLLQICLHLLLTEISW